MKWYENYLSVYEKPFESVPSASSRNDKKRLSALKDTVEPQISVVLICHNEEEHLVSCLWSLCENRCHIPIEILAVNNLSSDGTEKVLKELGVTYFNEFNKGPGYARQCGLNHARGKYHLCIDADTIYPPLYIITHINQLMKPEVVGTFSLWSFIPGKGHSKMMLWCYETLRDVYLRIQAIQRPELCVRGMTFGFKTELGKKSGFRTDIRRGEDGSLALAMKPYGKLVFIRSHMARALTGHGTLQADGSLFHSFRIRLVKAVVNVCGLFTKKKKYSDKEDNMI